MRCHASFTAEITTGCRARCISKWLTPRGEDSVARKNKAAQNRFHLCALFIYDTFFFLVLIFYEKGSEML